VSTPLRADDPDWVRATAISLAVGTSTWPAPGGVIVRLSERMSITVTLAVARASLFNPPMDSTSPEIQSLVTAAMSMSSRSSWS